MVTHKIISKFGNGNRLALALGRRASTVQHWKKTGYIPRRHYDEIRAAAKKMGIRLTADDFVPDLHDVKTAA